MLHDTHPSRTPSPCDHDVRLSDYEYSSDDDCHGCHDCDDGDRWSVWGPDVCCIDDGDGNRAMIPLLPILLSVAFYVPLLFFWSLFNILASVWVYLQRSVQSVTPLLGRLLLRVLGMKVPLEVVERLQGYIANKERVVVIFPHSSCWDTFYMTVVATAYACPGVAISHSCWENYPIVGRFLRHNGVLFVNPKIDGGPGGCTQQIVDQLLTRDQQGFVFWISPTGGRLARPWRTGFYHIAKQTGASVAIIGIDYESHTFKVTTPATGVSVQDRSFDQVVQLLEPSFTCITPLHPAYTWPQCDYEKFFGGHIMMAGFAFQPYDCIQVGTTLLGLLFGVMMLNLLLATI